MFTLNTRPMQVPDEQLEPVNGPVVILWDIENCGVPSDVRPEDVAGNIRMALRSNPLIKGAVTMFSAYGDFSIITRRLREGCQRTGVKLVDVPNGRKDAADMAIVVDMFLFALDNPPPSTIMLISGDVDFAQALHVLGQRGYTIVLVVPSRNVVSSALSNAARFIFNWSSVVHGLGFISLEASTTTAMNFNRDTFTLQDEKVIVSHNRSEQAGFDTYKHRVEGISNASTMPSVPTSGCHSSLISSNVALGKGHKHEDVIFKVQPSESHNLNGLLPSGLSPASDKSDYHQVIQWPFRPIDYAACKFVNFGAYKSMKNVATTGGKGNFLFGAHFDQLDKVHTNMGRGEMKDKDVLSDSVSLVDTAVRCFPVTDLLLNGNPHTSHRNKVEAPSCDDRFTWKRPKEIKSTHSMRLEARKRDCNGEEFVEKQNQEKKFKKSGELSKTKDDDGPSGSVEDEMVNASTENEIRIREITSQTCPGLQPGEVSTIEMEVNNVQSEKHYIFRNVDDSTVISNLPKLGDNCQNIDKLQDSSNVTIIVDPINSPDISLLNNVKTVKEKPLIEMKLGGQNFPLILSPESKLGGNLETMVQAKTTTVPPAWWCDICSVEFQSELHLNDHKQGGKHRDRLLKLYEVNCDPNSTGFVELKAHILTCSKEMPVKGTCCAGAFAFDAGADVETKAQKNNTTIQCSEENLGFYKLSNEKENFEKLKNAKSGPALGASPAVCDSMKSGKESSIAVVSSKIFSVTKVRQKKTSTKLIWCNVCDIKFYGEHSFNEHEQGKKHRWALKKLQMANNEHSAAGASLAKCLNETSANVLKNDNQE